MLYIKSLSCGYKKSDTIMENRINGYKAGQVWNYKTRKGEEGSFVTILKVEEYPKDGTVIHVAVDQVNMTGQRTGKFFGHTIGHMPFSEEALKESVTQLKKEMSSLPEFEEGYNNWKEQFEKGNAGVFSVTVAEAVEFTETTLDQ
jgi:hypothetical protein